MVSAIRIDLLKFVVVSLVLLIALFGRPVQANDIFVTTNLDGVADNNLCSLRDAIIETNRVGNQ
jgi:CSLREA domain-containing protein